MVLFISFVLFYHFYTDIRGAYAVLFLSRKKRMRYMEKIAADTARAFFRCGKLFSRINIIHEDNTISLPEHFIVLSNHQSFIDIFMVLLSFPRIRFVAKKELGRHVPAFSTVLRYGRHCLINRYSDFRKTYHTLAVFTRFCALNHVNPHIFPEGTRSRNRELQKFNIGAYRIVQSILMVPTVVLAVDGGWKFSRIIDFIRRNSVNYKVKILTVLPAPENKKQISGDLERARTLIAEQLTAWQQEE